MHYFVLEIHDLMLAIGQVKGEFGKKLGEGKEHGSEQIILYWKFMISCATKCFARMIHLSHLRLNHSMTIAPI
jgi:hypothetical protein